MNFTIIGAGRKPGAPLKRKQYTVAAKAAFLPLQTIFSEFISGNESSLFFANLQ